MIPRFRMRLSGPCLALLVGLVPYGVHVFPRYLKAREGIRKAVLAHRL